MNGRRPSTIKECKTKLKLFDYQRKSQCTKIGEGNRPENGEECKETLKSMQKIAISCIQLQDEQIKAEEEAARNYYRY